MAEHDKDKADRRVSSSPSKEGKQAQKYGRHPVDWDVAYATVAEALGKHSRAVPGNLKKTGNISRASEDMETMRARKGMVKAVTAQLLKDLEQAENDLLLLVVSNKTATRLKNGGSKRERIKA